MALLLSATLALGGTPDSDSCFLFLRYLARHQMPDGSWGGRASNCTCPDPAPPPAAPADPRVTAALIRALGDDDPGTRDAAERELRALDRAALAALQAASKEGDCELRLRAERARAFIVSRTRGEGDTETTGLALLAFLGAGYTHLSRDAYDGVCFGSAIRSALRWLADRQDADGRFDAKDLVANSVAALALCEAWAWTGSNHWKDAAERGVAAVLRTEPEEPRELAWKAMVVASAHLTGIEGPLAEQTEKTARALPENAPLAARAAVSFLHRLVAKRTHEVVANAIADARPAALDAETRYLATASLFVMEGHQGWRWKAWSPALKEALVPSQVVRNQNCERGAWEAADSRTRLRTAALGGLALETYYRYAYILGTSR